MGDSTNNQAIFHVGLTRDGNNQPAKGFARWVFFSRKGTVYVEVGIWGFSDSEVGFHSFRKNFDAEIFLGGVR
jgi:hypothetical protein